MILFTNGCSWTYGGSLNLDLPDQVNERLESVWPHHLGAMLGAEKVINLAVGCGSNQRTARTTYDWFLEQTPEDLAKTVAVIQITEPSRYEFHIPRNDGNPDEWIKCKVGVVSAETIRPELNEFHWKYNDLKLSLHTDLEGVYNVLSYCDAMASLFKKFNVKHYFWNAGFFNHKDKIVPEKISNYFENTFNWFDSDKWKYQNISNNDAHPSFEGHRQISKQMFDYMNNPGSHTR